MKGTEPAEPAREPAPVEPPPWSREAAGVPPPGPATDGPTTDGPGSAADGPPWPPRPASPASFGMPVWPTGPQAAGRGPAAAPPGNAPPGNAPPADAPPGNAPQPPPYAPPPTPYAPAPVRPTRTRPAHRTLWIVLACCAAAIIVIGGATAAVVLATSALRGPRAPQTATVGQPARDGALQFTAEKVTCGVKSVGPPEDSDVPTGQFCVVRLRIRNVGTAPAIFADTLQEAYAPNGNRYSTDSEAILYANPNPTVFLSDINPGNGFRADIIYDIPVGERIAQLRLHTEPHSRGVVIKLR